MLDKLIDLATLFLFSSAASFFATMTYILLSR